jgi:hypothetical protein
MSKGCRAWFFSLACAAALAATRAVGADTAFDVSGVPAGPPAPSGTEQATVARYWALGRPRPFVAASIEAGFAYLRPRFVAGVGQPYWRWIGVEAYPLVSVSSVGQYFGLGGGLRGFTLRAGARYLFPFSRSYLVPRAHYARQDLDLRGPDRADYLAYEAEATGTIPSMLGSTFFVLTGEHIELAPEGSYLYEDSLHVVIEPPWVWRGRVGHVVGFGQSGAVHLGIAADLIGLPGRNRFVVRAGVIASVDLTTRLDAQASFIPVISSPDSIGLLGGDFGQLGIRYRFATGSTPVPRRPSPEPTSE